MKQSDKQFLQKFQLQTKRKFQLPINRITLFLVIYSILVGIVIFILLILNINWMNIGLGIIYLIYELYIIYEYCYIIQSEILCPIENCFNCVESISCAIYVSYLTKREIIFLYDIDTRHIISDIFIGSQYRITTNKNRNILSDYFLSNGEVNYNRIGEFHTHPNSSKKLQFSKVDIHSYFSEQVVCDPKSYQCLLCESDGTQKQIDLFDYFHIEKKENINETN